MVKAELSKIYKDAVINRQSSSENADAEARNDLNQQHVNTGDLSILIKDLVESVTNRKEEIQILKGNSVPSVILYN